MRASTVADDYQLRVSGHYASDGEHWSVEVIFKENVIASAYRLVSSADARTAGEFLRFGATKDWKLLHHLSSDVVAAGVAALEEPAPELFEFEVQPPESERLVRAVVSAVRLAEVRELLYPPAPPVTDHGGLSHEEHDDV